MPVRKTVRETDRNRQTDTDRHRQTEKKGETGLGQGTLIVEDPATLKSHEEDQREEACEQTC